MRGSKIAAEIIREQKRAEFWKNRARRIKCKDRQCEKCKYKKQCFEEELL